MLVLGIDPGTAITGYGVVRSEGGRLQTHGYGALRTPSTLPLPVRLQRLYEGLRKLLATVGPDAVAVEELFFNRNVRTALAVGQARGVALLAAAQAGLPVYEYTPQQVKMAVTGYGGADKEQVTHMVVRLLRLEGPPRPDDVADALAVAICHVHAGSVAAAWRSALEGG